MTTLLRARAMIHGEHSPMTRDSNLKCASCSVHFWRLDASGTDYSFDCVGAIRTGHTANIFGVRMLPSSASTLVTCARDSQVRVFDATRARTVGSEPGYQTNGTGTRGSPLYLTAQEAGAKVCAVLLYLARFTMPRDRYSDAIPTTSRGSVLQMGRRIPS